MQTGITRPGVSATGKEAGGERPRSARPGYKSAADHDRASGPKGPRARRPEGGSNGRKAVRHRQGKHIPDRRRGRTSPAGGSGDDTGGAAAGRPRPPVAATRANIVSAHAATAESKLAKPKTSQAKHRQTQTARARPHGGLTAAAWRPLDSLVGAARQPQGKRRTAAWRPLGSRAAAADSRMAARGQPRGPRSRPSQQQPQTQPQPQPEAQLQPVNARPGVVAQEGGTRQAGNGTAKGPTRVHAQRFVRPCPPSVWSAVPL